MQLVVLARRLQSISPDLVEKRLFESRNHFENYSDAQLSNDRKLYLLIRVIFDLPENASKNDSFKTGGWITMHTDINNDGTFNLAWPIKWKDGSPVLVSGYQGIESLGRYDASIEYHYLRSKYRMRNLFSFPGIPR